ncbi:MAG: chemotaxis protein CheC [Oscillospiraceae bacterium]|nr:chemotaxis protein CheC [Oscillospiraceae bacterium]
MYSNYGELSPIALDCLKEIGNIGSGSAASALSQMLGKSVQMRVPDVKVLDFDEVIEEMGGPEKIITGILVDLSVDICGIIMFLLEDSFANIALNTFLGKDYVHAADLDEMDYSVIKEMGNIMAGSYLQAISKLTDLTIDMSTPSMNVDMLGAIMSVPVATFAEVGDKVLYINDGFVIDGVDIKSNIILIPDMESLDTLMKKLGVIDG